MTLKQIGFFLFSIVLYILYVAFKPFEVVFIGVMEFVQDTYKFWKEIMEDIKTI